ncbi:MAG: hypothetical protein AB2799_21405 [Candidatus Thiodiazotropha sp.]
MEKKTVIIVADLLDQVKELRERLIKESDVGGVLISTSFLEACLASMLQAYLKKSSVTEKLLNPISGTIGNYRGFTPIPRTVELRVISFV